MCALPLPMHRITSNSSSLGLSIAIQSFRSKILLKKQNFSIGTGKYEYVKSFEVQDEIKLPNIILVRLSGRNFTRFSDLYEFEKPYDLKALELMNACAMRVMEEFPDIVLGYGFSDEYSFAFKTDTEIYQRRASKIHSIVVSLFSSAYVIKWKEFFPQKELESPPSFKSRAISCASMEVLQTYLSWRQRECHSRNLYDTCFWKLIDSGKSEMQAKEILEESQEQARSELLFELFNMNYKSLPDILRLGSCAIKTKVEVIVEDKFTGSPVTRLRRRVIVVHAENIEAPSFWNGHSCIVNELGRVEGDINELKPEYLKSFLFENNLMPADWIVVRIDGCHFHSFCEVHQFIKPNDEQAANLMNESAKAVMREFNDIVFSYGYSDEYSFVLKKDTSLYGRNASEIVSAFVSLFSSVYVMQWETYFTKKALIDPPHFDGRSICYSSNEILLDYLAWRQVDCHRNNKYNTCFWFLVKSGMSRRRATKFLQGTKTQQKNELLFESGIDYKTLPLMFRHGTSIFWDKEEIGMNGRSEKLVVEHCNIIDKSFWTAHPTIFEPEPEPEENIEERLML